MIAQKNIEAGRSGNKNAAIMDHNKFSALSPSEFQQMLGKVTYKPRSKPTSSPKSQSVEGKA